MEIDAAQLCPFVTWGTNPGMVAPVTGRVPEVKGLQEADRRATELALQYMGLEPGKRIEDIGIDRVFIGSCTNSRIEDLRAAARVAKGHQVSSKVRAMVVPGSQTVKRAAEQEGLHRIFQDAGFEWRESGCSMCLGMNPDILQPGRAVRFDEQPEFRRAAGTRRTDASGESDDGGRGGDCGAFHGYKELEVSVGVKVKVSGIEQQVSCHFTELPKNRDKSARLELDTT